MKPQTIAHYDSPAHFEPLMPADHVVGPLLEKASDLTRAAVALSSSSGALAQQELRGLLRAMNSYYSNRIEGEHTRPSEIERALQQDFSDNADLARRQRLAVAHVHAEQVCESTLDTLAGQADGVTPIRWLYSPEALLWMHGQLFAELPQADRQLADGSMMTAGAWRERQVAVGRHEAPVSTELPRFVAAWQDRYSQVRQGEASIVALAAAHHRLAWMHPFLDGNGRVARLHTHLGLHAMGLTRGLWSPLRGFARSVDTYRALLQAADEARQGDLDGRGNLTQAGLMAWISYVIEVCIDQATFMATQLNTAGMRDRIAAALSFEEDTVKSGVRKEALMLLHYLFSTQAALPRGDAKALLGMKDRLATSTLSALLKRGFLATDSAYGLVRFAVPRHALRFYLPALWPEAEADSDLLNGDD